jgi:tRNA(fMet)-specific endonuclease VapC
MYLLDTDTLTHAHAGHPGIKERVQQVGEANVATTIITAIEILRGRYDFLLKAKDSEELLRAQQLLESSEELLQSLAIVPLDAPAASEFDKLRRHKKVQKIGRADVLIACIALVQQATLVSRNARHFRQVPGLKVENWIS